MELIVEQLDPEWTCFVRCPDCDMRTFACCDEHAVEGMREHISANH